MMTATQMLTLARAKELELVERNIHNAATEGRTALTVPRFSARTAHVLMSKGFDLEYNNAMCTYTIRWCIDDSDLTGD